MTLARYAPEDLDQMALRLLDLAARVRGLAQLCRQEQLAEVPLHSKKAEEWLEKLEGWSLKVATGMEMRMAQQKAERLVVRVRRGDGPKNVG